MQVWNTTHKQGRVSAICIGGIVIAAHRSVHLPLSTLTAGQRAQLQSYLQSGQLSTSAPQNAEAARRLQPPPPTHPYTNEDDMFRFTNKTSTDKYLYRAEDKTPVGLLRPGESCELADEQIGEVFADDGVEKAQISEDALTPPPPPAPAPPSTPEETETKKVLHTVASEVFEEEAPVVEGAPKDTTPTAEKQPSRSKKKKA